MTIQERVRYILDDLNKDRYNDTILDTIIKEAIHTLSIHLKSFYDFAQVSTDKQGYFSLPNCLLLSTVFSKDKCQIPLLTEQEIRDQFGCSWREDTGSEVKAIVYGSTSSTVYRVYPKVDSLMGVENLEQVLLSTIHISKADVSTQLEESKLVAEYVGIPPLDNIPPLWEKAIVYYVSGTLLRFDKDEQNRQFGNEQYQYFKEELRELKSIVSKNFKL